jgi:hypothetical protein
MSVPVTHCVANVCTTVITAGSQGMPPTVAILGLASTFGVMLAFASRFPLIEFAGYSLAFSGLTLLCFDALNTDSWASAAVSGVTALYVFSRVWRRRKLLRG